MVENVVALPSSRGGRRQFPRIAVELPGYLKLDGTVTRVIVEELSAGGATIETSRPFPYGVALTLQIEGAGNFEAEQAWWSMDHVVGVGTDRRARETLRVGLKFSEIHRGIYDTARRLSGGADGAQQSVSTT